MLFYLKSFHLHHLSFDCHKALLDKQQKCCNPLLQMVNLVFLNLLSNSNNSYPCLLLVRYYFKHLTFNPHIKYVKWVLKVTFYR